MNEENISPQDLNQLKKIDEMKRQLMAKMLTKEALERLARVKSINEDLAGQAELYLLQIYQSGKLRDKITDEKLKDILRLLNQKREIRIKRL